MLFDSVQEYESEISLVRTAIRRQLTIGEENENDSGGASRRMKEADLNKQRSYLSILVKEKRRLLRGGGGVFFTPGW